MMDKEKERRKYKRYNTAVNIHFDFTHDLETKVKFKFIDHKQKDSSKKYSAVSKNISVEGLCFSSEREVKQGDLLDLEVYLPNAKDPILMRGKVRWCKPSEEETSKETKGQLFFLVGVLVTQVNGESVPESVYYDKEYDINWSIVMETVLGDYKMLMGEKYKKKSE